MFEENKDFMEVVDLHWNPRRALLLLKIDLTKIQGIDEEYASFIGLDLSTTLNYEMKLQGVLLTSLSGQEKQTMTLKEIFIKKAVKFHAFSQKKSAKEE